MDKLLKVINPVYWVAFLIFVGRQARKRTYRDLFPGLITIPLGFAFSIHVSFFSSKRQQIYGPNRFG